MKEASGKYKGGKRTHECVGGGGSGSYDSKSSPRFGEMGIQFEGTGVGDETESRWETLNTPLSGKRLGGT